MTNTGTLAPATNYALWLNGSQGYMMIGLYPTMNAAERAGEQFVASDSHYGTRYSVDRY